MQLASRSQRSISPLSRSFRCRTALVVTDPQIDFLSPKGVTWGVVGKSVDKVVLAGMSANLCTEEAADAMRAK